MNDELERMPEDVVVAFLKLLSRHLPKGISSALIAFKSLFESGEFDGRV